MFIGPLEIGMPDGSIKTYNFAWCYPAFLILPLEIIELFDKKIPSINRVPSQLFNDLDQLKILDDLYFYTVVVKAYAHMVWPHIEGNANNYLEVYSNHDPIYLIAHWLYYWVEQIQMDIGVPGIKEIMDDKELFNGFWEPPSIEESFDTFSYIVPRAIERLNFKGTIETVREFRCFEDFADHTSTDKIDYYRKWYHTRSKHPQISLEQYLDGSLDQYDGYDIERDVIDPRMPFEDYVITKVDTESFMSGLSDMDRRILELRLDGKTYEEIASEVGFKTHSAVLKRIKKIGAEYQRFSGKDLGF